VIDDGTPNEAQDKRWHAYVKGLKYAGKEFTEDVEKEVAKLHEKEGGTAWEDELVRYNPEDPENQG
jgi:predicted ester cyclase